MLRIDAGPVHADYCDQIERRHFLQLGAAGAASLSLPSILKAKEAWAERNGTSRKDTSCILIWLDGGPSHLDMYDMKPEAPAEYRGLWKPIPTNVSGIQVTELFPRQARLADKFSIVRSLHHDNGDHFTAAHWMLTGRAGGVSGASTGGRHPGVGAVAARLRGPRRAGIPAYVSVPYAMSIGLRPGYFDPQYLGSRFRPFETEGDPNDPAFQVQNLGAVGGLSLPMLEDRRSLLGRFDNVRRSIDRSGMMETIDRFQQEAYEMVVGPAARKAFAIGEENPRLRDEYGRHSWGQSVLLARRLVEAGATFVTCHIGGWDHHWNLKAALESQLPIVDAAVSALLRDLDARGLLEKTLVVMCGEFSRTPRMNDGGNGGAPMSMGTPGRDHWGAAMFAFLAGGGIRNGQIVGATDRLGERPKDKPYRPENLLATIYQVLGIDPTLQFVDHAGRPTSILDDTRPIAELL